MITNRLDMTKVSRLATWLHVSLSFGMSVMDNVIMSRDIVSSEDDGANESEMRANTHST